jgi:predicted membrane-bound spermidine synthase
MDANAGFWIIAFVVVLLLLAARARRQQKPMPWIHILFFSSGFPALIYQIVWQRALFAIYGLNIQSVTIVVSAFMLGLGLGSLAGGALSKSARLPLVVWFALAEFGTAAFGVMSLKLFRSIAEFTTGSSPSMTGLAVFSLIIVPTLLMGATLPLLVEHLVRSSQNIGRSVGGLYFANTLGSGVACFVAADVLMRLLGQSGSIQLAASINVLVAAGALVYSFRSEHQKEEIPRAERPLELSVGQKQDHLFPFPLALFCSAFCGFGALAYEIIWYRLLTFATGDTARVFASLLGSYLLGLALGSRFAERHSQRNQNQGAGGAVNMLGGLIFASAILGFAVSPGVAFAMKFVSLVNTSTATAPAYLIVLVSICLGAFLFGAIFPLIAHVSVDPASRAGAALSLLYAANIIGSTLGSFVVGFILMDHLSLFSISLLLLVGGVSVAAVVLATSGRLTGRLKLVAAFGVAATSLIVIGSHSVMDTIYDRLLFKNQYPKVHFQQVVEGRSGMIGVTPNGAVFGGGIYDGRFNVDLMHDVNMVARPFALSAFHPTPRRVLMIGLGSGSWAQVVANQPQLEELTVVEINPGYLKLIPEYSAVSSLLGNPKVRIAIDDGRRWLVRNPGRRFDAIVMNTTFHWRNHISNLLSVDFLRLARQHLNSGGVLFYNTTGSEDVMATGLAAYPYALRFWNCLAVSDSPIVFDRTRWKAVLLSYVIDGKHVIDSNDPKQMARLNEVVNIKEDPTGPQPFSIETDDQLRKRLHGRLIITDDNMGVEWR